ncbi:hypothetical protein ACQ0QQ_14385 [Lysinibacillus sphaericus]
MEQKMKTPNPKAAGPCLEELQLNINLPYRGGLRIADGKQSYAEYQYLEQAFIFGELSFKGTPPQLPNNSH